MKTGEDWYQEGLRHLDLSRGADSTREYDEDRRDALSAFTQAIALEPGHLAAQTERALLLAALGHPEEALDSLVALVASGQRAPRFLYEAGRALVRLHRAAEAVPLFEEALAAAPDFADAAFARAEALFELGRDEAALRAWDEALSPRLTQGAFFFRPAAGRLQRARLLARLGKPEAAEAFAALLVDPQLRGPSLETHVFEALAESKVAREAYLALLAKRPDDKTQWQVAAGRFLGAGEPTLALEAWDQVLRLDGSDFFAWYGKGEAFAKARRFDEAIAAYRQSLALKPDFLGARARLEVALKEAGR